MLIVLSLLILGSSSGWFSSLNVSKDASFQVKKVHEWMARMNKNGSICLTKVHWIGV